MSPLQKAPEITPCQCAEPGWCERHGCRKTEAWWQLCQTRPDYFQLWEAGKGPGQAVKTGGNGKPVKKKRKRCGEHKIIRPAVQRPHTLPLLNSLPIADGALAPHVERGIVTGASSLHWCCLGTHAMAAARDKVGLAIADHGLESEQREELDRIGVRWLDHEKPDILYANPHYKTVSAPQAWWKPWVCWSSPFDRTAWIDSDTVITKPLTDLLTLTRYTNAISTQRRFMGGGARLYQRIVDHLFGREVGRTILPHVHALNTGVIAFQRRDPMIAEWIDVTKDILATEEVANMCQVRDQSAFLVMWIQRILARRPRPLMLDDGYCWPADDLTLVDLRERKKVSGDPAILLQQATERHPEATVVHWLGWPKPWDLRDDRSFDDPSTWCQCVVSSAGGWCERHQTTKTAHFVKLCREKKAYFDLWEMGVGPGQDAPVASDGPGNVLRQMLGCGHKNWTQYARMNSWGSECKEHIGELAALLANQNCKDKISVDAARRLVLKAVEKWEARIGKA